jgi:hypothetical protein
MSYMKKYVWQIREEKSLKKGFRYLYKCIRYLKKWNKYLNMRVRYLDK